jgi:ectoine hydroxylase-related dioxygenase (phytanoyl-CoA dioxygenase family)
MEPAAQTIARHAEFAVVPSAVPLATCSTWLALVDAAYRRIEVAQGSDFVAESSSFRLRAVATLSVVDIWSALSSEVRARCVAVLGPRLAIDADQCWVRRQYDPESAPPRHRPHSWHQDGALGYEFSPSGRDAVLDHALLQMVTCWIALEPCGVDAPGLEVVTDGVGRMLSPRQLTDVAVDQQWPTRRRARPVLEAGESLVFGGDVLHRTHVTTAMTRSRTSIELRCFRADAVSDRIAGDEFVAIPTEDIESAISRTGT